MFSTELFPTSEAAREFTQTCLDECGARSCATCLFTAEANLQLKGVLPYVTRTHSAQYRLIRDVIRPAMVPLGFDPSSGDTLELLIDRTQAETAGRGVRIGVLLRQTAQYHIEQQRLIVVAGSPVGVWWAKEDDMCQWRARKLTQITQDLLQVMYVDDPAGTEREAHRGLTHWLLPACWSCPLSETAQAHWEKTRQAPKK